MITLIPIEQVDNAHGALIVDAFNRLFVLNGGESDGCGDGGGNGYGDGDGYGNGNGWGYGNGSGRGGTGDGRGDGWGYGCPFEQVTEDPDGSGRKDRPQSC